MSACYCKHCSAPVNCQYVHGVHVEGACPNGCDGKVQPRMRTSQPEPLRVEETYTARRQRLSQQAHNVKRNRRRTHAARS